MTLLGDDGVSAALADLPGWSGDARYITRTVTASDFLSAIRTVDDVAMVAETMDHHPDIDIRWRTLTFTLSTHSAGGVTAADVELARGIDEAAERHGAT
ncbi:MAG: 4a-hydroxytetrahydrobiopterin dehydratase [Jiangellaceae bacterium]